ncbi:MAG: hypothetical protein ABIQ62_08075 [Thermomonas sp.]
MIHSVVEEAHTDVRLRLAIGVTAHRDLVAGEVPALREAIRSFLKGLQAEFPDLPLRLISALAEGGDQLAAEEALALGIELVVPLPMPQDEYEKDFTDPAARVRFRELLAQARVRVLPMAPGNNLETIAVRGEHRNLQYAQLGMFISSHCQLLLALWDGHPSTATGGTAQVVAFHIHNVMPGLSVEQVAPNLLADDESDLVYHLPCSRRLLHTTPPPGMLDARWLTLSGSHPRSQGTPTHYRHVFGQMQAFNLDMANHVDAIAGSAWSLFDDRVPSAPPATAARVERLFHAADWLAIHFQRRVRTSLLCTHVIAALMGLAFILFSDVNSNLVYVQAFLLLFGLGMVVNLLGRRRQWQRKYLDYRGLAEGLRVQIYWRMAGVEPPANTSLGYDSFLQKQDVDLSWIRHAMRGSSLLRDEGFHSNQRWLAWVVAHWIGDAQGAGGQLAYYRQGTTRRTHAYHATERLGTVALAAGLLGALLLLLGGADLAPARQQELVLVMGLLPLLAGIREAYSYKKADKELIKQFRFMSRLFESCGVRLQHAQVDAQTRQILLALGRACLEEHAEWILLHRERPLEHAQLSG